MAPLVSFHAPCTCTEPFVVPASGYVPLSSQHPAESLFSPSLLDTLEEGSSPPKQQPWRAGAHALYLSWLRNPNLRLQLQYQEQQAIYLQQKAQHDAQQAAQPPMQLQPQPPPTPPQPPKQQKKSKGLFACFGCGGGDADADDELFAAQQQQQQQQQWQQQQLQQQQAAGPVPPQPPAKVARLSDEALKKLAEGFVGYKDLPLSSSHPYWNQLVPR